MCILKAFKAITLVILITPSFVQAQTASITGTITEPSGAVVPGATVTTVNTATSFSRSTVTGDLGVYRIENLTPGTYDISIEKTGFKTVKYSNVILTVVQVLTVDSRL